MDNTDTISVTSPHVIDGSILMLLVERPDHGYALAARLGALGLNIGNDVRALYRRLHSLERKGLVEYQLSYSDKGPARKVYRTTQSGKEFLHNWAIAFRSTHGAIMHWLDANSNLLELRSVSRRASIGGGLQSYTGTAGIRIVG